MRADPEELDVDGLGAARSRRRAQAGRSFAALRMSHGEASVGFVPSCPSRAPYPPPLQPEADTSTGPSSSMTPPRVPLAAEPSSVDRNAEPHLEYVAVAPIEIAAKIVQDGRKRGVAADAEVVSGTEGEAQTRLGVALEASVGGQRR
jgi:hypothetical protein